MSQNTQSSTYTDSTSNYPYEGWYPQTVEWDKASINLPATLREVRQPRTCGLCGENIKLQDRFYTLDIAEGDENAIILRIVLCESCYKAYRKIMTPLTAAKEL